MNISYFLFIILIFEGCISAREPSWHWSWVCNSKTGRCEKLSQPSPEAFNTNVFMDNSPYTSQTVCRLTCGKYGALWPLPTISTFISTDLVAFHPSAIIYDFQDESGSKLDYLEEITRIFKSNILKECGANCSIPTESNIKVFITASGMNTKLTPDTDESYSLNITTNKPNVIIQIQGGSVFGARHGLETLSQLVASYKSSNSENGLVMVANANIKDKPIYKHRGLLLDTARNYLTIKTIKKQIDAMAASKMNVLHWHATDSQSFPIQSIRVPQLSKYGAYSSKKIYKLTDISGIISYGNYRGVRILLEIDAPSHSGNGWQWGPSAQLGALAVCVNKNPWRQFCIQPPCGQLNPANHNVYTVLGSLYKDLLDVMTSKEQFHMGGDEVFIPCWNSTEEILEYMERKEWGRTNTDFLKLWSEFQGKSANEFDNAIVSHDTSFVLWSSQLTDPEVIETYLPKNRYIIQTWVPTTNDLPRKLLEKGYRLIISTKNAWYLDHGFWGNTQYYTWRIAYKNRILRHEGILGGEVCMWGELVDETSIESRIWPRAAAVAERLWSDPDLDVSVVETRFYRHRERLVTRGIDADAVAPRWCYQNEGECL